MKKLFGAFLALFASVAFATTTVPVQLLNPAGSTAGQAAVSTGPTTPPTWGAVSATSLASQAANTVVANFTASSASPTAFAMPSCTGATNALGYTSGTGIVCNSSINAATLGGATFASPGSIGGTAAAAGSFTTLNASGNDALNYATTAGQSIPNSANTTITTWTKVVDRVNANFNASTGTFTAPATGIYQVAAQLTWAANTAAVNSSFSASVSCNGTTVATSSNGKQTASSVTITAGVAAICSLTSGQTIVIQAFQNSGGALPLATNASQNYVMINRLP